MRTEVRTVSPELAEEWLDRNKRNRPLSRQSVNHLSRAIERGEWQLTHQGIAFDEDDVLIDGQHRLAAVVKAGMAVPMAVTYGVPREAFTVMDTGRKRTGRDALALQGEVNSTHLAAALRGLYLYLNAHDAKWSGGSSLITNDQLVTILNEHPGMREAIIRGMALNRAIKITVTAASVGWYITRKERPDVEQADWHDKLLTGAGLEQGDPRLTLRNTLLGLAAGNRHRKSDDTREHLVYYLKAWNAWVEERPLKLLRRYSKEQMPKVTKKMRIRLESDAL
ncbi:MULTISPECIES: hypothetical protein [unclassified Streptomyces]|uniref:hypothetical protein n=1 Tax=unclassified Streptomyces TaxID=2593676 RepID=UPI00081E4A73|nr:MULTISPECIES: hypothetical protein [unclassified Streptomyces]MYR26620.1 hypothetical protein [Streptomyces sp. SID4945]SCD67793.1 hypothetical protein GA0115251_11829 [Streptomyces sp. TverLS-915]SCF07458.1 hypothetical protein GA0115257_106631 [Streptomyces sp. LcepLS]